MTTVQPRTIEDRLDEIEHCMHEIKALLLRLTIPRAPAAEQLGDEYMNVKELALFAKIEPSTIYSACAKHELKFIRLGKLYKFRKIDVLEWLNKNHNLDNINVDEYVDRYLQEHILRG